MTPEERVRELKLELPAPPAPIGNFLPWRRVGQLLYLSGQGPRNPDGKVSVGRLGKDCSLDHVEAVVKLLGMVNAEPDFKDHPKVINGCSDVLVEVLGERGRHARSAVGMGSLPNGMTVEVEAIIQIADGH